MNNTLDTLIRIVFCSLATMHIQAMHQGMLQAIKGSNSPTALVAGSTGNESAFKTFQRSSSLYRVFQLKEHECKVALLVKSENEERFLLEKNRENFISILEQLNATRFLYTTEFNKPVGISYLSTHHATGETRSPGNFILSIKNNLDMINDRLSLHNKKGKSKCLPYTTFMFQKIAEVADCCVQLRYVYVLLLGDFYDDLDFPSDSFLASIGIAWPPSIARDMIRYSEIFACDEVVRFLKEHKAGQVFVG